MYLESLSIKNFRKFRDKNNTIYFVSSKAIKSGETGKAEGEESLVAPSSTLIIGKNNAGKTTIARALVLIAEKKKPSVTDFNIDYLRELLLGYESALKKIGNAEGQETPSLEFKLCIRVSINEMEEIPSDLVNNISQFVPITPVIPGLVEIIVKCQIREEAAFRNVLVDIIQADYSEVGDNQLILRSKLEKLCEYMSDEKLYKLTYYTSSGQEVADPSLSELIKIKEIRANRHLRDGILSEIYQKIISLQFSTSEVDQAELKANITTINDVINKSVTEKSGAISEILRVIEKKNHVGVGLSGNVTEGVILKSLIKYSFSEGDDYIPENQFGLGYINLLNIIGEIIHYIDGYEDESFRNRINLLFIEEPEAFMHPQMQEFFISRIDSAVKKILDLSRKDGQEHSKELHCQIAITTHSSHILNSKIHSCNSFDNINYLAVVNKAAECIGLNDKIVCGSDGSVDDEGLKFIKKHIKYKVSELFFSDAVIIVEGITEETLLQYYLSKDSSLRNYYISVFNIGGAHGKLYYPLIKSLNIPCLIVTDLDIKRYPCEKNEKNSGHVEGEACPGCGKYAEEEYKRIYKQITSLDDRFTTNTTIKSFHDKSIINDIEKSVKSQDEPLSLKSIDYFKEGNLYVIFQRDSIGGQFATSFEEAFILTNFHNDILNKVLSQCKPNIYKGIVGNKGNEDRSNLLNSSFEFQKKLSDSKSEFANGLLYEMITSEIDIPKVPKYIEDGLEWLSNCLEASLPKKGAD